MPSDAISALLAALNSPPAITAPAYADAAAQSPDDSQILPVHLFLNPDYLKNGNDGRWKHSCSTGASKDKKPNLLSILVLTDDKQKAYVLLAVPGNAPKDIFSLDASSEFLTNPDILQSLSPNDDPALLELAKNLLADRRIAHTSEGEFEKAFDDLMSSPSKLRQANALTSNFLWQTSKRMNRPTLQSWTQAALAEKRNCADGTMDLLAPDKEIAMFQKPILAQNRARSRH